MSCDPGSTSAPRRRWWPPRWLRRKCNGRSGATNHTDSGVLIDPEALEAEGAAQ